VPLHEADRRPLAFLRNLWGHFLKGLAQPLDFLKVRRSVVKKSISKETSCLLNLKIRDPGHRANNFLPCK
jgi:hypothetical protein